MSNWTELRQELLKECESEFTVFRAKIPVSEGMGHFVEYSGEPSGFLKLARSLSVKLLYVYETEIDANLQDRDDIPQTMEIGFSHEGTMHVARMHNIEPAKVAHHGIHSAPKEEDAASTIIAAGKDPVVSQIVQYVKVSLDYMSADSFNIQYFFKKFWESKGIDKESKLPQELRQFIDSVESEAIPKLKLK